NTEEGLGRVKVTSCLDKIGPVDTGDETKRHGTIAVVLQCLISHDRTKIGTADTYVDNVANAFARMAFPLPDPNAIGQRAHLTEHFMNLRDDVLAVYQDR